MRNKTRQRRWQKEVLQQIMSRETWQDETKEHYYPMDRSRYYLNELIDSSNAPASFTLYLNGPNPQPFYYQYLKAQPRPIMGLYLNRANPQALLTRLQKKMIRQQLLVKVSL